MRQFVARRFPARTAVPMLAGLLGVLVGAAIVGGVTAVSAHGGDTSMVHSCVNRYNGAVRIVGPTGACQFTETALDWSTGGDIYKVETTLALPAGPTPPFTFDTSPKAFCDPGDAVVSAGVQWQSLPAPGVTASVGEFVLSTGEQGVAADALGSLATPNTLIVIAVCADVA